MKHHRHEGAPETARAVALSYAAGSGAAPRVSAKGQGLLAERILELAREHGVPVRRDRDLLALLGACELGEEIPFELYEAVARLLVCLQRVNEALREG